MRAPPINGGHEEPRPNPDASMGLRNHKVLEPAAPPIPDRKVVLVDRGQSDCPPAVYGQQDVSFRVLERVAEALAAALDVVIARRYAWRLKKLLDQREDSGLVLRGGGTDADP